MDNSNEIPVENESTKITDLNNDCLEVLFEYLHFDDLLNIVEASNQFYSPVCLVYKRKYAEKDLVFDRCYTSCPKR